MAREPKAIQLFLQQWQAPVEDALKHWLRSGHPSLHPHYGMMQYHMGWVDADLAPHSRPAGKRLRPMLVLLVCDAMAANPARALPAACSMEILHNYSLLHDDIEDLDEMRRHYPTVWKVWGNGLAINAGDGMYACAFQAMLGLLEQDVGLPSALEAMSLLTRACVQLTEGQFLDLNYENRARLTLDEYLFMVWKKTASLFSVCLEVGAVLSGSDEATRRTFRRLGEQIGIAYQMLDDLANIWGAIDDTGKASCRDIIQRKKSFPIVMALADPDAHQPMQALYARPAAEDISAPVVRLLNQHRIRAQCQALLQQRQEAIQALLEEVQATTQDQAAISLDNFRAYLMRLRLLPSPAA